MKINASFNSFFTQPHDSEFTEYILHRGSHWHMLTSATTWWPVDQAGAALSLNTSEDRGPNTSA